MNHEGGSKGPLVLDLVQVGQVVGLDGSHQSVLDLVPVLLQGEELKKKKKKKRKKHGE